MSGLLVTVLLAGCHAAPVATHREAVSGDLVARTGHALRVQPCAAAFELPPGVSLDRPLMDDDAIAVALWNNGAFQELLADLGLARADLIQAGLLPNPEFYWSSGVTDKPFRYLVDMPIEVLWLRPLRLAAAGREMQRTEQRMVQSGLDLIRDVRQALVDVRLARARAAVAREAVKVRGHISELAKARLDAGDATPQEAATARVDAAQATQDAVRTDYDVAIAEERLRFLMGVPLGEQPIAPAERPPPAAASLDLDALLEQARRDRPDAQAAEWAIESARERVRLARLSFVRLLGIADATSGRTNHILGPALRVTVPVFHQNQDAVARAEAELSKTEQRRILVDQQIVLDVRQAFLRYEQGRKELAILEDKVLPDIEAGIGRADRAYREGSASILIVLETARQLLDSRLRQVQLRADLERSWAELERGVGRHLPVGTGIAAPCAARFLAPNAIEP